MPLDLRFRRSVNDGFVIDTDPTQVDVDLVHEWLSTDTYWAEGRSKDAIARTIETSIPFGVYDRTGAQVGFARIVTDAVTFAWLADVYIARDVRGRGLGKALADAVLVALAPFELTRVLLVTADAHSIYESVGFVDYTAEKRLMVYGKE